MATQLAGKDSYQLPADEASGSKLSIVGEDDLLTLPAVTTQLNNEAIEAAGDRDSDDTDIELEVESGRKSAKFDTSGKNAYLGACRMFNQVPVSYFLRNGDNEVMRLRHHSVGPLGVKAICVALISNTTIEVLDLHDNGVEDQGCQYMAEMLKENYFITELTALVLKILSNNNIGPKGAAALFDSVKQSDSLIKLDLSGNKLGDRSAKDINEAMTENTRISHLNLGNNGFGEKAGEEFGKMLFNNYTLLHLDVSSNNFRTTGVQLFFQGLKKNISLVSLNFANNGIGVEGCADVCKALKENKTLEEVNISNNRIPLAGTVLLAKAFKVNVNLQCLDVSRNPFQASGCMVLTEALMKTPHTALRYISFNHILVTRQVCELQQTLEMEKFILFSHGGINEGWKTKASKVEPKTTREVLCFLTAEECQQLGTELQAVDEQGRGKVTQQTFRKVMMDIGWNLRCAEITRRLVDKVKDLGYIEYSSLLPPSDQVSKTSSKESGSGYTMVN